MRQRMVGTAARALYRRAGQLPLVGELLRRDYESRFAGNRVLNLFRGVYTSFDEARRSAPPTLPVGYDHPAPAQMYRERLERVYTNDYPVLFWLQRALAGARRLVDFGGHVGVAYYAYQKYLAYPAGLEWVVCDVPAVVESGRQLARERGARGLTFTTELAAADGADVFFASGSLQYVEAPLASLLSRLARPPAHLLVNLLPLHPSRSLVTLQSIGSAFCPYRVQERAAFVGALEPLGYEVVDSWDNPDKACDIPFHPGASVHGYSGLYLRARAARPPGP